jgi:hypothetical protein
MDRPGAASQARNALGIAVRVQLKPEAIMRSDSEIERDVREELKWDPDLDASDIAVSVKNGVVTLAGFVKSFTDKSLKPPPSVWLGSLQSPTTSKYGCRASTSGPTPKLHGTPWRQSRASYDLVGAHQDRRQKWLGDARSQVSGNTARQRDCRTADQGSRASATLIQLKATRPAR